MKVSKILVDPKGMPHASQEQSSWDAEYVWEESCLGAQKAMAPNSSTEPVFVLHWSSSRAFSRLGTTSLTPWADSFNMTALAQSSVASRMYWLALPKQRRDRAKRRPSLNLT